jgi:hypothetical protein
MGETAMEANRRMRQKRPYLLIEAAGWWGEKLGAPMMRFPM